MRNFALSILVSSILFQYCSGQGSPPWEHPLLTAFSIDGIHFSNPALFQDSSGVPCAIHWKGDTIICVFQWFREPVGSSSWDRVAVKYSYDDGIGWTDPVPVQFTNMPANFQRPFDPTLVKLGNDSLRIYFSSSDGMPVNGDSIINTYSAVSTDGLNFEFEPNARVDLPDHRLIDPALIYFNHALHYLSPAGAPQDGAFHFLSQDGLHFNQVQDIHSDSLHNWTGNYVINDTNELRFYGCGSQNIWYNSTPNGGVWNGYISTNLAGGDPSVFRKSNGDYQIIFTGMSAPVSVKGQKNSSSGYVLFPNPAMSFFDLEDKSANISTGHFYLYNENGSYILSDDFIQRIRVPVHQLHKGKYYVVIVSENGRVCLPLTILK